VSDTRPIFGWCETDKVGPCVDPFGHGAHMANEGGIVNVNRKDDDDPPIMCAACYQELRAMDPPKGWPA